MKQSLLIWLVLSLTLASDPAFAMGKRKHRGGLPGGLDRDAIAGSIALNPYIMTLENEFETATKPVITSPVERTVISDAIQIGKRYECRVYYAVTKNTTALPPETKSWYQFKKFGDLFLDNQAFMDNARIKTFAPNTALENELWGQSQERNYYEAIRVRTNGDLIIQSFAPEQIWISSMLDFLGLKKAGRKMLSRLKGFALPTLVANATGFIISYSYCPANAADRQLFDPAQNLSFPDADSF